MLRLDAETNSAPRYVLTLTSRDPVEDSAAYRRACATFWQAFRRRFGRATEYCGFIEWTTGEASTSGGLRRMHSHWLIKHEGDLDLAAVNAWVSAEWCKLTGAWVVQLAELRSVGGVVGYLALHHEKMQQSPPPGWTGRRLRPSQGYFASAGAKRGRTSEIRARARLWLAEYREQANMGEHARPFGEPVSGRLVWGTPEAERASDALADVGRGFDTLPARRELDRRLADPDAPYAIDRLSALAQDQDYHAWIVRRHYRDRAKLERELAGRRRSEAETERSELPARGPALRRSG